jgi:hypothetical protein
VSRQPDFEEFTEEGYRRLLKLARPHYGFAFFGSGTREPHVVLRHDVDYSPHRALALAKIEQQEGVRSTFLWLLHSEFYNLLERGIVDIVRHIAALGHRIGLHFDLSFYDGIASADDLVRLLRKERRILTDLSGQDCPVFSFHNPDTNTSLDFAADTIAGMLNIYGKRVRRDYKYVSDSNGFWRFDNAFDLIASRAHPHVHILIHPEWWTPQPLPPRGRMERSLRGRMEAGARNYDAFLEKWGRRNVR